MPAVTLLPEDATELADLLRFLNEWIDAEEDHLDPLLTRFASTGYDVIHLRVDLARYARLLSNTGDGDGEPPF